MKKKIIIRNKEIGENHPCFIIAGAGINHNGKIDLAKKLVDVAVDAGVDAVGSTKQYFSSRLSS